MTVRGDRPNRVRRPQCSRPPLPSRSRFRFRFRFRPPLSDSALALELRVSAVAALHPRGFPAPPIAKAVHLWVVPVADPPAPRGTLWSFLSEEERCRAARFRFPADRDRALVARGVSRLLLASYLSIPPAAVEFAFGAQGKPALARSPGGIEFNVSHSGDWVLIGIGNECAIGVDVERIRPLVDLDSLIRQFLAPGEACSIHALPQEQRLEAFFRCWTRKEAYVKALGSGLSTPLDRFEVSTDQSAALLSVNGTARGTEGWSLWSGSLDDDHLMAAAVDQPDFAVTCRVWRGGSGISVWQDARITA
jgi:4'-phosphopantetheinyl transferase